MTNISNPFDALHNHLNALESKVDGLSIPNESVKPEIINRRELCVRLDITEPTAIRWEKKKKIPSFRIGSNVRYNWPNVISVLEGKSNNK